MANNYFFDQITTSTAKLLIIVFLTAIVVLIGLLSACLCCDNKEDESSRARSRKERSRKNKSNKLKPRPPMPTDMVPRHAYGTMAIVPDAGKLIASQGPPGKKDDKVAAGAYGTMLGIENKMVASQGAKKGAVEAGAYGTMLGIDNKNGGIAGIQKDGETASKVLRPPGAGYLEFPGGPVKTEPEKVGVGQYGTMLAVAPGALKASVRKPASPTSSGSTKREEKVAPNLYGTMAVIDGKMVDSKRK